MGTSTISKWGHPPFPASRRRPGEMGTSTIFLGGGNADNHDFRWRNCGCPDFQETVRFLRNCGCPHFYPRRVEIVGVPISGGRLLFPLKSFPAVACNGDRHRSAMGTGTVFQPSPLDGGRGRVPAKSVPVPIRPVPIRPREQGLSSFFGACPQFDWRHSVC